MAKAHSGAGKQQLIGATSSGFATTVKGVDLDALWPSSGLVRWTTWRHTER